MKSGPLSWRGRLAAIALLVACAPAWAQSLDARSRFGFELRTRWGQVIAGDFPAFEGEVRTLPDGRRQVRIRLASARVEVAGSQRYTRFARGERFLDAARHPWVEFVSEPYPGELVRRGGALQGTLSLHGVDRRETFELAPAECARPAYDCDVVGQGRVRRTDYGMTQWRWALTDEVRFRLRVRLQEPMPANTAPQAPASQDATPQDPAPVEPPP